jgi:hypothetical protein
MREYLFRGKRVDNGEWVEGYLGYNKTRKRYYIMDDVDAFPIPVHKESVGQYTGFDEWMLDDVSRNAKLYEGDIIEVWCNREIYGSPWSTHDGKVKFRGVIVFEYGKWHIDFKNKYNETICKAKGKEEYDREVPWGHELYRSCFHHLKDRDKLRQKKLEDREKCLKWGFDDYSYCDDIVKIGTVFENADLLEG